MDGSMDGRVECRGLRRSGGGREVAELEVWMDGRVEGRVLRRSALRLLSSSPPRLLDLVSSENGVTTVEKLRKYKYNPFLVYFTSL